MQFKCSSHIKKNSGPFIQVMCSCCSGAQMQLKQNGDQGSIKRINHKLNKTPRHKRKSRYMGTKTADILIFQCLQTSIRAEENGAGRGLVGIKEPPRVRTCRDGAFSDCEPGFNLFLSKWKNPQPPRLPTELLLCRKQAIFLKALLVRQTPKVLHLFTSRTRNQQCAFTRQLLHNLPQHSLTKGINFG